LIQNCRKYTTSPADCPRRTDNSVPLRDGIDTSQYDDWRNTQKCSTGLIENLYTLWVASIFSPHLTAGRKSNGPNICRDPPATRSRGRELHQINYYGW